MVAGGVGSRGWWPKVTESGGSSLGQQLEGGWWWLPWRLRGREGKESFDHLDNLLG